MIPRARSTVALALGLAVALAACSLNGGGSGAPGASGSPTGGGSPGSSTAACPATPPPDPAAIPEWSPESQDPAVYPVIVSSSGSIACGQTRFVFSFLDKDNVPVAAPDVRASVAFYDLGRDPKTPVATVDGTFVWAIEDERGVYVTNVDFPTSGVWGAEFMTNRSGAQSIRVQFEVQPEPRVVSVGDAAPASDTPTLEDVGGDVGLLSTDDDPVEAFYQTSVADALEAGEPFLLVFATPKFCASAQCGPTLDRVKPIAAAHPNVTAINVEPYQLEAVDGQLQPVLTDGQLTTAPATEEWRLLSEPWLFVVDRNGIVTASFEGIVGEEELDAAIAAVE